MSCSEGWVSCETNVFPRLGSYEAVLPSVAEDISSCDWPKQFRLPPREPYTSSIILLNCLNYCFIRFQFISYMIRYLPFCKRVCWALGQLHWLREIMVKGDIIAVARCRSPRWPDRVTGFPACPGTHQQLNIVFESDLFI